MPPKKKFKVMNPGKPIIISKAKAPPKKIKFKVRNPGKPIVIKPKPKEEFKPPKGWRKLYDGGETLGANGERDLTHLIDNVYKGSTLGKMTTQHRLAARDYKKFQSTKAFKTAKNVTEIAKRFRQYVENTL